MAVQTLDLQQRKFVNETVRPFLDRLVNILGAMDALIADFDAQQDAGAPGVPIVINGDDLGDGTDGTAPRDDAPVMTGTLMQAIRDNAGAMRAEITAVEYNILVALLVRDLATVQGL